MRTWSWGRRCPTGTELSRPDLT
uniref:Uncharacterized protein n=1 Tax=Anguilla anguilla TaxID=7936 RepID=A0A0E9XZQ7_ANGAN